MMLTRGEKRALVFLSLSFACGLVLLLLRGGWGESVPLGTAPPPKGQAAPIDINLAGTAELVALPGIGPALAARIVELRDRRGGFRQVEELLEVKGIGPKRLARVRELVCAGCGKEALTTEPQRQ